MLLPPFLPQALFIHAWLLMAPSLLPSPAIATAAPAVYAYKNIFILAGQSNMAGRGGVINNIWDGIVPPECRPNPSILRLSAGLEWTEAKEPLHIDIDVKKMCGIGPGLAFANALAEKDPGFGVIGLVPCAVGGTNISEWRRGSHLYRKLVRRAERAMRDGGSIRALLWFQGEQDTITRSGSESYGSRLDELLVHLRTDLHSPMLPIFQVALASGSGPYVEVVRAAQLGTSLPNVRCVDAKGLSLEPDGLHLTTAAQVRLGQMLAHSFLQTVSRPSSSSPLHSDASQGLSCCICSNIIRPISGIFHLINKFFFSLLEFQRSHPTRVNGPGLR